MLCCDHELVVMLPIQCLGQMKIKKLDGFVSSFKKSFCHCSGNVNMWLKFETNLNIFSALIPPTAHFYLAAPPMKTTGADDLPVPNVSQCQNEQNCAKRKLFIAIFGDNDWRNDYCPHLLTFVDFSQLLPTRSDALSAFMSCLGILFMSSSFSTPFPLRHLLNKNLQTTHCCKNSFGLRF